MFVSFLTTLRGKHWFPFAEKNDELVRPLPGRSVSGKPFSCCALRYDYNRFLKQTSMINETQPTRYDSTWNLFSEVAACSNIRDFATLIVPTSAPSSLFVYCLIICWRLVVQRAFFVTVQCFTFAFELGHFPSCLVVCQLFFSSIYLISVYALSLCETLLSNLPELEQK